MPACIGNKIGWNNSRAAAFPLSVTAKLFATPELDRSLIQLGDRTEDFFGLFPQEGRQGFRDHHAFLDDHGDVYGELMLALEGLCTRLELTDKGIEDILPLFRRARLIDEALRFWMECADNKYVYWIERRGRGLYLQATPIDVSQALATRLMNRVSSVIVTSATLAVAGSFDYARTRLGLESARTLQLESQYDYAKQVLFYVPPQMPDPRSGDFPAQAAREVGELIKASRGIGLDRIVTTLTNRQPATGNQVGGRK